MKTTTLIEFGPPNAPFGTHRAVAGIRRRTHQCRSESSIPDQLSESVENAEAAHLAYVDAREHHIAARRLLNRIDKRVCWGGAERAHHPISVLVVDDVPDLRDLVAGVLRQAGFLVRTAVNGLDALLAAHEMKPSVIVMDVTMPVLNGLEATRLIKAAEGLREAKVIATPALARSRTHRSNGGSWPSCRSHRHPTSSSRPCSTQRGCRDLRL